MKTMLSIIVFLLALQIEAAPKNLTLYDRLITPTEEQFVRGVYSAWITALNQRLPTYTTAQLKTVLDETRTSDMIYFMALGRANLPANVWQRLNDIDRQVRARVVAAKLRAVHNTIKRLP